jgi:hypothetical protein
MNKDKKLSIKNDSCLRFITDLEKNLNYSGYQKAIYKFMHKLEETEEKLINIIKNT